MKWNEIKLFLFFFPSRHSCWSVTVLFYCHYFFYCTFCIHLSCNNSYRWTETVFLSHFAFVLQVSTSCDIITPCLRERAAAARKKTATKVRCHSVNINVLKSEHNDVISQWKVTDRNRSFMVWFWSPFVNFYCKLWLSSKPQTRAWENDERYIFWDIAQFSMEISHEACPR